jgi:hypothetical protein
MFRRAFYGGIFLAALLGAQNPATTVTVDALANRHAINPNIYGVAYGDATTLPDLNVPLNRYGGNNSSRYNWQINADNRGSDWYFESIGDTNATAGERGDTIFSTTRGAGAQAMLTVPMVGWVAKLGANRNKLSSFSIAKYGAQTGSDFWFPDAGSGVLASNGQNITGNDPNDANVPADSTYQQGWIQHLVSTWGKSANGGVGYYILDNEHSIWFGTHRDVHSTGPTMDEIKTKMIDYAGKIKAVDPTARVVGPEEWGWSGYFYSGYDQQWGGQHGWSNLPDRANHGGQDYLPWLLSQLKQSAVSTGQRPLDVFSVHYYPQSGEFGNDTSTTMQLLRNKSTRSLWDPNYVDQSWINDKVQLISRLKSWVSTYYFPGTPVAITEYNWGAESHINGATTQADILGIFGREGLDMATRWTTPDPATPTYKAMKMYRNYDGSKLTFGDTSISATVANPDNLSAFAAIRTVDGALTVIVINKVLSGSTPVTVALNNFSGSGTAQVYQLTAANSIQHLPDIPYSGASVATTAPPQSVTLLVLPKSVGGPAVTMSVNRSKVNFGISGSLVTQPQAIRVGFNGGSLGWTASSSQPNITVSPALGNGKGSFVITAAAGPSATVTVTAPGAANSPLQVQVNVAAVTPGSPYGSFDTPVTNTVGIAGAIPVTGWALDNIEVSKVDIWREPMNGEAAQSNGLVYIGDAVFVDGARPDVETANPNTPLNWRGGWGYLMLTNFLPATSGTLTAGNGTYVLHALAHNKAGNSADLGTKTIACDNAHASKPFGTIDTPGQGATVAGTATNFGWALTQQPHKIAIDGSTITVVVDGQAVGHPVYNQYRSDIATVFPGYANSGGAVGFFMLDTTALADGLHTISWVVYDNAGRVDGVGSRYFTVQNGGTGGVAEPADEPLAPVRSEVSSVETEELGRIELSLGAPAGHLLVGGEQRPLPIGSSIKDGTFYWEVGPGFLGEYQLLFERPGGTPVPVRITVHAKDSGRESTAGFVRTR